MYRDSGILLETRGERLCRDKKREARRSGERQNAGREGCRVMKRKMWLAGALVALLWATPAKRITASSCAPPSVCRRSRRHAIPCYWPNLHGGSRAGPIL